jgi:hypothetical protein
MGYGGGGHSWELEQVRLMLFPYLSPEEGSRRIDGAIAAAADPERLDRIEQLANDPSLDAELARCARRTASR